MNILANSYYCDGCKNELKTQEEKVSGLCRKCYRDLQKHNKNEEREFDYSTSETNCEGCGKKLKRQEEKASGLCDKCHRGLEKHNRENREGSVSEELVKIAKTLKALSPSDVKRIKEIKEKSTINLGEARNYLEVINDCVNLSSGTLASLTGYRDYSDLDDIRDAFVFFTETLIPKKHYGTWMEAWKDYASKYGRNFKPTKRAY